MLRLLSSLFAGLIFGLGLVISGMINPAKVQNFLDITGSWDPSLAFVMGAALIVTGIGFALLRKSDKPLFDARFQWPTRSDIDPRLVSGSALFGTGWGLAGFCPGPAISAAALGLAPVYIFLAAMVAGIGLWRWLIAGWLNPQPAA
jgi:uncharacterized membrane protein YedE/YeeE